MRTSVISLLLLTSFVTVGPSVAAQESVGEGLFGTSQRNAQVPSPAAFLERPLSDGPTTVDEAVRYARHVARESPRVALQTFGRSYGGRPLVKVTVSAPENLELRERHREEALSLMAGPTEIPKGLPVTAWFGMSIHGNEASGVDAALVLLHHLATHEAPETLEILARVVLVIELCSNPDGRDRYVLGVRDRRSLRPQSHPLSFDQAEPWPGGRTNHYLFDLNRDWFLQTQIETRLRIPEILKECPQVLADFHEMGSDQSYYFSAPPGPPVNQHISASVREVWTHLGQSIAEAFDRRQWPYWEGDVFPADYPGYGGSWPCFLGAAGMTLEQASARGSSVSRRDGSKLTYREAIEHHAVAGLAILSRAAQEREKVLQAFARHFREVSRLGLDDERPTFLFTPRNDPSGLRRLHQTLRANGIACRVLTEGATLELAPLLGGTPEPRAVPAGSIVVSARQPFRPLVLALLDPKVEVEPELLAREAERQSRGESSQLYDVTAWNLPLLFGVESFRGPPIPSGIELSSEETARVLPKPAEEPVAWLAPGNQLESLGLLMRLLEAGVKVRITPEPIRIGGETYGRGTLVVLGDRNRDAASSEALDRELRSPKSLLRGVASYRTSDGIDLGNQKIRPVVPPKIVVAAGPGVGANSFGGVRWLLEEAVPVPHVVVSLEGRSLRVLEETNVLVLPDGDGYDSLLTKDALTAFLARGGTIVALRGAAKALAGTGLSLLPLVARTKTEGLGTVAGAICRAEAQETHWLAWGTSVPLALQSRAQAYWAPILPKDATTVVSWFSKDMLHVSGILPKEKVEALASTPVVIEKIHGRGRILAFLEDPAFRGTSPGMWGMFLRACLLGPSHSN